MRLSNDELSASLRQQADYFQSAEGGWRDDTAARLNAAADRIDQLNGALRVAYGQVRFYRKEAKRAWDGDFVRLVCEAAMKGEPEPGDNWRNTLNANPVEETGKP